jgi:flagellar basal-body rod modification protein FlgD
MSFTSHAATASSTTGTTTTTATTAAQNSMPINQDQFLQMLMAELKNQNPMNPNSSDPMQFVSELAQFTQVEQATYTAESTQTMVANQNTASAVALIGHTVTYTDPTTQATATGVVKSVELTSNGPTLTINGTSGIAPSTVSQVS